MKLSGLFNRLMSRIYPPRCPYCDGVISEDRLSCDECAKKLEVLPVCSYAMGGVPCLSPFPYDPPYSDAVKRMKFHRRPSYAPRLAAQMALIIAEREKTDFDVITCVPMHPKRIRRRGFNQAELLARELASLTEVPYEPMLRKTRDNPPQHKMNGFPEKIKNVRGLFKVEGSAPRGRRVLLVDDVITSGATLGACARALKNSGASAVSCVTVCGQRNK